MSPNLTKSWAVVSGDLGLVVLGASRTWADMTAPRSDPKKLQGRLALSQALIFLEVALC